MTKISIAKILKYLIIGALEFIWSLEFGNWNFNYHIEISIGVCNITTLIET